MRFTWKMISLVSVLLAISLSIGGYSVIQAAFSSKLSSELYDGREDMRMFSLTTQAICADALRSGDVQTAMTSLQQFLAEENSSEQRTVHITDEEGRILLSNQRTVLYGAFEAQIGVIEVRIRSFEEQKFVVASQRLSLYGNVLYMQRCREITDIYLQAQEELSSYSVIMLIILLLGVGITAVMTFYLTRPIRSISRAAQLLSKGHYDKRAKVSGSDELEELAGTFNQMADTLEQKISELADAAQRQKDFTASFAHELKTPLTSVIGYADTLRSRVLPPQQQIEAASYILREGKRLEAMSIALLDLFALERDVPEFRTVSVRHILQDTAERCSYLLKEKGLHIEMYVQDLTVRAVPELLQTLLYNLIDNARKASRDGGVILIRASVVPEGVRFSVLDHGTGIPEEALSRLTEPFYMVNKSRSRAQGGAGLGLALCRRIAELHHSVLIFESEVQKGTCVSFVLGKEMIVCEKSGSTSEQS